MKTPIRILIIEDNDDDKELLLIELRRGGYNPDYIRVDTEPDMRAALDQHQWDIIISDYSMPNFSGIAALRILKERNLDIPFILISGTIGEEIAVKAMKEGASDYLMKGNIQRLIPAIGRELKEAEIRRERARVEEALQKNEAMLSLVLNAIPQSIFWKDKDSIYLGCNKLFAKVAGFEDPAQLIGKSDFDLPWSREESEAYRKVDKKVIESQQPIINFVEPQTQHGGKQVWVETTKIPLKDIHNSGYGVLGIYDDITQKKEAQEALKKSELRFRTLAESSPVGIFTTDAQGATTYVNTRWCEISKLSFEEALGDGWLKAIHPEDKENLTSAWQQTVGSGLTSKEEYRFIHPDGSSAWVIGQAVPQKDENGNLMGYMGTITDITERKKMEADLIQSKERAEESDRLKTSFLQNISHEIRTPLNSIVGFSRLMAEPDTSPEELDNFANIISESSDQLTTIIEDIIQISTIETGQSRINEKEANVNTVCTQAYNQFSSRAQKMNIDLICSTGLQAEEAFILTDEQKLLQVLHNLVSNAIKFTKEGSITIGYRQDDSNLVFFVEDTGIGIAPEMHQEIFKNFRQVEYSLTRQFGGSGLGLTISKANVELLGGKIWVESEIGKGARFCFTLPYKPTRKKEISSETPHTNSTNPPSGKLKILIAEDMEDNFTYLSVIVRNFAREILCAENGKEAVRISKENKDIDLIFMDIKMPEMNGYEATVEIRKFNPDVIIIAQTAYALTGDREKIIEAGCNDYVSKPIRRELLKNVISQYFEIE